MVFMGVILILHMNVYIAYCDNSTGYLPVFSNHYYY